MSRLEEGRGSDALARLLETGKRPRSLGAAQRWRRRWRQLTSRKTFPFQQIVVCRARRFLFLALPKNASSSVKRAIHRLDHGEPVPHDIHGAFGHWPNGRTVLDSEQAADGRFDGYVRFAVYRDPVRRACSYYESQVGPRRRRDQEYVKALGLSGCSFDDYLDFARWELRKRDPLRQDQHVRRMSDLVGPGVVDHLVPLERLEQFLSAELGVILEERANASSSIVVRPTPRQERLLRRLYRADFELPERIPLWPATARGAS